MENKELKQPIPEELKDEQLDAVNGGSDVTTVCPKCGNKVCAMPPPSNYNIPHPSRVCISCDYQEW